MDGLRQVDSFGSILGVRAAPFSDLDRLKAFTHSGYLAYIIDAPRLYTGHGQADRKIGDRLGKAAGDSHVYLPQYGFGELGLISLSDGPTDQDLLRYDCLTPAATLMANKNFQALPKGCFCRRRNLSFGLLTAVCCQPYISELAHRTVVALAPSELVRVAETARLIRALPGQAWIARAGSEVAQRLMPAPARRRCTSQRSTSHPRSIARSLALRSMRLLIV
jgi:hypothetical protein